MRLRTTAAATVVVAAILAAAGGLVVVLLRQSLVSGAELRAELAARTVCGQLAAGVPAERLDLSAGSGELAQVIGADGRVRAAGGRLIDGVPMVPVAGLPRQDGDVTARETGAAGRVEAGVAFRTVRVAGLADRYRVATMHVRTPRDGRFTIHTAVSLEDQQRAVDDVRIGMVVLMPVVVALVAMTTWLIVGWALRPVSSIRSELAAITTGDLSRRVPVPRARDEIHDLAVTTNHTLAALDSSVGRQRRFIADASHELRSPLAVLRARLEVAAVHPDLLDLDATVADVVRLQDLATDLLLLARLDAGERPPADRVELTDLVRDEVARRSAGDVKPVHLDLTEDVVVAGASGRLVRVLTNLLDNAQRHAAGRVRVRLRAVDDHAELRVSDDGSGIPVDQRDRIFDRFVRLDEPRSRDAGGAGLGLAIVREVVTAHRGHILVGDSEIGGAAFTVSLPTWREDGDAVAGPPGA